MTKDVIESDEFSLEVENEGVYFISIKSQEKEEYFKLIKL